MKPDVIQIYSSDTVAVAIADVAAGATVETPVGPLVAAKPIARGHKIGLVPAAAGSLVIKYGHVIGVASRAIAPGDWVHSHNLSTLLDQTDRPQAPVASSTIAAAPLSGTWMGYDRGQSAGTRNEIWILPTVGCVGRLSERLAREAAARHVGRVDGVHAFAHPFGCSQLGDDLTCTRAILAALASNPNTGGVLLLGLGCESNQLDALVAALHPDHAPVRVLGAQAASDEMAEAMAHLDALADMAAVAKRSPLPASRLSVGLKCGGSDGLSGITANALLGRFTDRLTTAGGHALLTEVPEIFGAEQVLLGRASDPQVAQAGYDLIADFKAYFRAHGEPVSENPSPGNIAGGITTLEEKSLGAIQKAGRASVVDVRRYGAPPTGTVAGVTLVEAPGNDAVSTTALAAAGASMILFTTGRGTPLGSAVPTVKIASNSALAERKPQWIDFDAGVALGGDIAAIDAQFDTTVLAIASGAPTAAERLDQREIALWKRGVTL